MEKELVDLIVGKVMKAIQEGDPAEKSLDVRNTYDDGAALTLESASKILVENPHNEEALKIMRKSTPARIAIGRCGARPKTSTLLNFLADHAAAQDAVFMDVSSDFLAKNNLFQVQTLVKDKAEYLQKPELGKKLTDEAKKTIAEKCEKGKQVQIIVVDGLSSTAVEANVGDILPSLLQGLKVEGISVGTPFFVKYGRVGIQDEIGMLLNCDVVVELVGERPGLVTAESLSSYMIYRPSENTVEADRTVISNIHRGGTPPTESGAHMAGIVKKMLGNKASGVKLSELIK
ncbi:MAG TPA: ethanolamine ammonia-lyase subunit EutC [Anaerovoracaceae bacterium]|nr:ethanolamine ammonia-lyase subunit EutC [Anaerovoracaceae bacterium]